MKTILGFSAALIHLVAGQDTATTATPSPTALTILPQTGSQTWPVPPPGSTGNFGTAICGQGFTYCGYILRDHQNFREEDIVRVYCASGPDNCANGKTKTDPLQALYVCLPPQSVAIPPVPVLAAGVGHQPALPPHPRQRRGGHHAFLNARQASGGNTSPAAAAPSTGGLASNGGDTCSSTPTTGNQLALLCSCGNQCLNPKEDHIGRCDSPCA